jgi:hypothetical protein
MGPPPDSLDHREQAAFAARARMRGYALRTCAPALFLMPFLKQKPSRVVAGANLVPADRAASHAPDAVAPLRVLVCKALPEPQPRVSVG